MQGPCSFLPFFIVGIALPHDRVILQSAPLADRHEYMNVSRDHEAKCCIHPMEHLFQSWGEMCGHDWTLVSAVRDFNWTQHFDHQISGMVRKPMVFLGSLAEFHQLIDFNFCDAVCVLS